MEPTRRGSVRINRLKKEQKIRNKQIKDKIEKEQKMLALKRKQAVAFYKSKCIYKYCMCVDKDGKLYKIGNTNANS